jgi:hypothetical protein
MEVRRTNPQNARRHVNAKAASHLWRVLLLALLPALSNCYSPGPTWTKQGTRTADLRRDLADCEREGTGLPPWHFWALNMTYDAARERIVRVKKECMEARGWRQAAQNAIAMMDIHDHGAVGPIGVTAKRMKRAKRSEYHLTHANRDSSFLNRGSL